MKFMTGWSDRATRARKRVPLVDHALSEASRVELVDRCLAIGAQALLALLPFLVVLSAWAPVNLADFIVIRLRNTVGLDSSATAVLKDLAVNTGSSTVQTGLIGLLVALVSASSFSRVLQRMYSKVFDLGEERRPGRIRLSFIWLCVWLVNIAAVATLTRWVHGPLISWTLASVVQVSFWWWTVRAMLLKSRSWLQVLPVALFTTAGSVALVAASGYVMPAYTRTSIVQFGGFGVVIALASWLVVFAGVLVVSALAGRTVAEHPRWAALVARTLRVELPLSPQP